VQHLMELSSHKIQT